MKDLKIRNAVPEDTEAICQVHTRSICRLCAGAYSPEQIEDWIGKRTPKDYLAFLENALCLVAESRESLLGFGILNPSIGELHALYVDPRFVGNGVGSALLQAVERVADSTELPEIVLNATLNSVEFYEERGYESLGAAKNRLPSGVELPCVRMRKKLHQSESLAGREHSAKNEKP